MRFEPGHCGGATALTAGVALYAQIRSTPNASPATQASANMASNARRMALRRRGAGGEFSAGESFGITSFGPAGFSALKRPDYRLGVPVPARPDAQIRRLAF